MSSVIIRSTLPAWLAVVLLAAQPASAQDEEQAEEAAPAGQGDAGTAGEASGQASGEAAAPTDTEPDAESDAESDGAGEAAAGAEEGGPAVGLDEIPELDQQTHEQDDDDFIPTEEIPVDQSIPFPTDI